MRLEHALLEDDATIRAAALPPVLRRFCLLFAGLTLFSEVWSAVAWLVFHRRPPYGGTFSWDDSAQDLLIFRFRFLAFHTPHFWDAGLYPFTYPAPLVVVYWLFYKLPHLVEIYLAFSILALLLWAWYFARSFGQRAVAFVLLTAFLAASWPVRFLLQTGNLETIVALLLGAGIVAAMQRRWWFAATLMGVAGSMKLYPFALLGLLLTQRRFREFGWGIAVAALATLGSLATLGPNVAAAQRHVVEGFTFLQQRYVLAPLPNGLQFNHSLFNLVKLGVFITAKISGLTASAPQSMMLTSLRLYIPIAALASLLLCVAMRRLPLLNQIIALTVCAVLLPPFSLDYTLVELLVPFGLLCVFSIEAWKRRAEPPGLALCFTCFAFVFSTGAFFEWRYRFAAQVRTLALLILLVTVLRQRFAPEADTA